MAGIGGGSSGSSQTNRPWRGQAPYLTDLYKRAEGLYGQGPVQYFPGQTVASRDPVTSQGLEAIANRGLAGSDLTRSAQGLNLQTTQGAFLGGPGANPYLDPTYERAARGIGEQFNRIIAPNIDSRFGAAGRWGSGAHAAAQGAGMQALGQSLGDAATNIYGGNYQAERDRMMSAANVAPTLAGADYADLGQAVNAGMERESYQQQLIDAAMQRFQFGQEQPYDQLARFSNFIGNPVMASSGSSKAKNGQLSVG